MVAKIDFIELLKEPNRGIEWLNLSLNIFEDLQASRSSLISHRSDLSDLSDQVRYFKKLLMMKISKMISSDGIIFFGFNGAFDEKCHTF